MVAPDDVVRVLREAVEPLSVIEIAKRTGSDVRSCDAIVWRDPQTFVWQPGHRWTLAPTKSRVPRQNMHNAPDVRSHDATSVTSSNQLRALTLSSGLIIVVDRRPLDSGAFFSVRSAGNRITLTLNSGHELFDDFPVPFEESHEDSPYKALCELLLSAWALYEDALPGDAVKRSAQDARLLWGRRVSEMLRELDDG